MKRYILSILVVVSVSIAMLVMGCAEGLQTFSKHGISFSVSKELKLEEYSVDFRNQIFQKGAASYEQGGVFSTEKNFMLLWATTVSEFTEEEVRLSVLTTPNIFESVGNTFQAKIIGDPLTQQINRFDVTFTEMEFTLPGWEAPGITAVWYCPSSQRTMQVILIHKQPKGEMERFLRSFTDSGIEVSAVPSGDQMVTTPLLSYIEGALPIMERHAETTETANQANRAFLTAFASGNQDELIKAFTTYVNILDWALNRVDSELLDFKNLIPPPEVRTLHNMMIEGLTKEQAGLTKHLSYYSSVLHYGSGNDKELDDDNRLLLEAQEIWLQAQYEFQDLSQKSEQ